MEQQARRSIATVDRRRPGARTPGVHRLVVRAIPPAVDAMMMARFECALEETVCALLSVAEGAPVREHVRWHFGLGCGDRRSGKRLRPRALLQSALDEGGTFEQALDAALAVELLHNYSLVHDDVEDGDALRHGREAVWSRYGLAQGVNAGDALCALTHSTLLRNGGGHPAERVVAMAQLMHATHLAMCAGQSHDLDFESAAHVSMPTYMAMIDGKSAVLFGAACELGAMCAGAERPRAAAYGALGRAYGRAFQIRDDVAGAWDAGEATGKPWGTDLARRKWTFPVVWALGGPPSEHRTAVAALYARSAPLAPADVAAIAEILEALGARAAAEQACLAQLHAAEQIAAEHGIDRDGRVRALFGARPAPLAIA